MKILVDCTGSLNDLKIVKENASQHRLYFCILAKRKKGNGQKCSPLLKLHGRMMLKALESASCPGEKMMQVSFRPVLESGGGSEQQAGMCDGVKGSWTEKKHLKKSELKSWEQDECPREVEKKEKSDTMTLSSFPIDPSLIQTGLTFLPGFQQSTEQHGTWVLWHLREICTS